MSPVAPDRTHRGRGEAAGRRRAPARAPWAVATLLGLLAALVLLPAGRAGADAEDRTPGVTLSEREAGKGGAITVSGKGWRPRTLLMMLVCGQSAPGRGVIGGTNSCANADGRAVTTDAEGAFRKRMPVSEPPRPCPCVVHVATVTGNEPVSADAEFKVAGHPVAPLPEPGRDGRLAVLAAARLDGSGSVLTWFGAPEVRRLVVTVGNLGSDPVRDPVFEIGTSHGVFAPQWEERQWRGTIRPGGKARVELDVQLPAGAHGDYLVSLKYGQKVLAEQPWGVGRPWGVTLFWVLLCVVVPAAVFRIGMAVVDRVRPVRRGRPLRPRGPGGRHRPARLAARTCTPGEQAAPAATPPSDATALPWFTPDSAPGPHTPLSAPHQSENSPTTKGNS
ncbi:hypothetical protein AS594_20830 [Streptomyces agglomeratus]|uniref:Neocarzinostatin family protein n=1 Tax=Streptomyces agglomeratus TaxID=285458 RepID=A0A1E5PAJ0_9ACTN|nr:hypothetical protein [Streptomyces agglomeratus]OEJ26571.1 hypothetical protein AS594_20830 [Streptomyces agglomeratus]OEJ51882.1 hypothetical protein BGK72_15015 [Streptomyces agglomeratus]